MTKDELISAAKEAKSKTPEQLFGADCRFFVNEYYKKWNSEEDWEPGFETFELDNSRPIDKQIQAIALEEGDVVTDMEEDYTVIYSNGVLKRLDWFMQPI